MHAKPDRSSCFAPPTLGKRIKAGGIYFRAFTCLGFRVYGLGYTGLSESCYFLPT